MADLRRRRRPPPVPPGTVAVAVSEVVPSGPPFLEVEVAGERVLLARLPTDGLVAFAAACPHLGRPLRKAELDGTVLTCRHHRHRYDLADGRCVWPGGPHDEALARRDVGEVDGQVWVALPPQQDRR